MGTTKNQDLSTRYKQRVDIHPWRTYPRRQQSFVNELELVDDVVERLPISRSRRSPSGPAGPAPSSPAPQSSGASVIAHTYGYPDNLRALAPAKQQKQQILPEKATGNMYLADPRPWGNSKGGIEILSKEV